MRIQRLKTNNNINDINANYHIINKKKPIIDSFISIISQKIVLEIELNNKEKSILTKFMLSMMNHILEYPI